MAPVYEPAYEAQRAADEARQIANARQKVVDDARRAKANDPGVVRENFQRAATPKAPPKNINEPDRRPHCMPRPKRGKSGSGKSKGFVPFC